MEKKTTLGFGDISYQEIMARKKFYFGPTATMNIAATADGRTYDPFFTGSWTYVGDSQGGNRSLNVRHHRQFGIDPTSAKVDKEVWMYSDIHADAIKEHFNEGAKYVVSQGGLIYPWSQEFTEVILEPEFHQHIICAQAPELVDRFGNKQSFKEIMQLHGVQQMPFVILQGAKIIEMITSGYIPNEKEVVVQSPHGINGRGTILFTRTETSDPWEQGIADIDPAQDYVVSDYVKTVGSPSVHMQISANEIAMYPVGDQMIVGGQTQGTDFSAFSARPQHVQDAIRAEAFRVAQIAQAEGYRGFLNVDMMIGEDEQVYVTEANAGRLSGTAGLANVVARTTERLWGTEIGSVFDHSVEAEYLSETDFGARIAMIPSVGRKHDGPILGRDANGNVRFPRGYEHVNHDGLEYTETEDEWGQRFSYIAYHIPEDEIARRQP